MDEAQAVNSVEPEVATPEMQEHVEMKETEQQSSHEDSPQEKNWRALRQKERDLENQVRKQQEFIEKLMTQPHQQPVQQVQEEEIPEDEYIPVGGVKKLTKKQLAPIEEELRQLKAQVENERKSQQFNGLKTRYPDFDDVVNNDTLSLLEQEEPELAQTIADLKDPYKIAVQSYKYIKASGLSSKVPKARRVREVEEKLEKNSNIVQSPMAYDKRPMAQAFKMTKQLESELYKEMTECASRAGFSY